MEGMESGNTSVEEARQSHPSNTRKGQTLVLAYQTIGIVYGGLSTSPLYVYPSINIQKPIEDDYLGTLSIIIWTMTLIGLIKYVLIVLQADDHGEGGTFALYSLLCQHAKIGDKLNTRKNLISNSSTIKDGSVHSKLVCFLQSSKNVQRILFTITMMGTCMLIGDGILTPAISVLSAVDGLQIAAPSIPQATIVIISSVLLIALFLIQRFGTKHVSFLFSPIMVAWLVTTPLIGAYNIAVHYPKIFKAVSPHFIVKFFSRHGKKGWLMLGGTVLCITGAESMFADLGHFTKESMQLAFTFGVYPSNLITYAGQAAYFIKHPTNQLQQGFYSFIPHPVFWPMFLISTLAAIVASQGVISACFSLIKQSIAMDYFPRVSLIHTSTKHEGQIYSPEVNYFLMVLCTAVVVGFRTETSLGNAFGVVVLMVMFITTILLTLVMLVVWGTPLPVAMVFLVFFSFIEGSYLSAVLSKFPEGGWFPFLVSVLLAVIMFSWVHGRKRKHDYELANSTNLEALASLLSDGEQIRRVPGLCLFYSKLEDRVPPIFCHYIKKLRSLHKVLVLINVRHVAIPRVPKSESFSFKRISNKGVYVCLVQYGYAEKMDETEHGDSVKDHLRGYMRCLQSEMEMRSDDDGVGDELNEIENAKEGAVHVMGKTRLVLKDKAKNRLKERIIGGMYDFLHRNCRSAMPFLRVPPSDLVEVGMVYEV